MRSPSRPPEAVPRPAEPTGFRLRPPLPDDVWLTVGIIALSLFSYVVHLDKIRWGPTRMLLELASTLPLLWRRRYPVPVALTSGLFALLVTWLVHPSQPFPYPVLVVAFTNGAELRGWTRATMAGLYLAGDVFAEILHGQRTNGEDYFLTILTSTTAFLLGILTQTQRAYAEVLEERAAALERDREAELARAAAAERARIARDMHDVVGHAVALMVVQAEAGPLYLRADPQRAEAAFDAISSTGRDAMAQLRRLLGVLKHEGEGTGDGAADRAPQPTLAMIDELVAQVRAGGFAVELSSAGTPVALAADAETAAYRVVQEALTNTLKHSGGSRSEVRLVWSADALLITVADDGRGPAGQPDGGDGGGHGLVGLRERLAAVGGTLDFPEPTDGRGFAVSAWIPAPREDDGARTGGRTLGMDPVRPS